MASNGMISLQEFQEHMRQVKPVLVAQKYKRNAFVFKELSSCSHVFLRALAGPAERTVIVYSDHSLTVLWVR